MNEPTSASFRPAPAPIVPGAAVTAQSQQLQNFHRDTAAMLDTIFRLTVLATQHAQHVVLPGAVEKIAEMQDLLVKQANLVEREKRHQDAVASLGNERDRHAATVREFEAQKEKWKMDRNSEAYTRDRQRQARFTDADQLLLPIALRSGEAESFVTQLIPAIDDERTGWRLRAALASVAFAETGSDEEYLLRTVQELFAPFQLAFGSNPARLDQFKMLLSGFGKEPMQIEVPKIGDPFNPITMATQNPELMTNNGAISSVVKWGVRFANKEHRKKALVT